MTNTNRYKVLFTDPATGEVKTHHARPDAGGAVVGAMLRAERFGDRWNFRAVDTINGEEIFPGKRA